MTSETTKTKAKLQALTSSFDELEAQLAPLFAQSLPETLVRLEPIQQAKLQTAIPYLVYDLIFIYLKSRGIDPRTHPVISELDRIKQYFDKIQNAENPPAKRTEIDKAATSRFIKYAITQAQTQWKKTAAEEAQDDANANASGSTSASTSSKTIAAATADVQVNMKVKMTSKMLARRQYEKELKELDAMDDEEEEEVLEVFEGEVADGDAYDIHADEEEPNKSSAKGKSRQVEVSEPTSAPVTSSKNKRRRPAVDPFAGYGDDAAAAAISEPLAAPTASKKAKPSDDPPSPPETPQSQSQSQEGTPKPISKKPLNGSAEKSKSSKKSKKKGKK